MIIYANIRVVAATLDRMRTAFLVAWDFLLGGAAFVDSPPDRRGKKIAYVTLNENHTRGKEKGKKV